MPTNRSRRPTMAEVAAEAGVSKMTVSYAYSQPQRLSAAATASVAEAAARLGYSGPHPGAQALRRGRAGSIGVVIGEHLTYAFDDPQAAQFLSGVAAVCAQNSVAMTLVPVTGSDDDGSRVSAAAVDGFVVWTLDESDPVLEAVAATGLPAAVHGATTGTHLATVGIDDRAAAKAIGELAFIRAQHPVVLSFPLDSHRRTGLHTGLDPAWATFPITRDRLLGLRDAWRSQGRRWSEVRVAVCSTNTGLDAAQVLSELLASGETFDTIAAMSDELALATISALATTGRRTPADVAITGFDDTAAAAPAKLSTIHQDLREQGARCARIALHPHAQRDDATFDDWQVIERATTRPRN